MLGCYGVEISRGLESLLYLSSIAGIIERFLFHYTLLCFGHQGKLVIWLGFFKLGKPAPILRAPYESRGGGGLIYIAKPLLHGLRRRSPPWGTTCLYSKAWTAVKFALNEITCARGNNKDSG